MQSVSFQLSYGLFWCCPDLCLVRSVDAGILWLQPDWSPLRIFSGAGAGSWL